jgi:hypothetical protein
VRTKTWAGVAAWALLAVGAIALEETNHQPRVVAVNNPLPIPPLPVPPVLTAPQPAPAPACTTTTGPFVPTRVQLPGVVHRIPVLPLHRDSYGTPGTPPLSSLGKTEMAFDLGSLLKPGIQPGSAQGNALLNAHTWPDGSALGNRLLEKLHEGDRIVLHGITGRLCYKVIDRVEVPATDPGTRFYATTGKPQIAIVVCSGRRLGPGHWTMRTIWYATPDYS